MHVLEVLPPLIDTKMTEEINDPKKMTPEKVASLIIAGLNNGKEEVYPGIAKVANVMSRINFKRILKIVNA